MTRCSLAAHLSVTSCKLPRSSPLEPRKVVELPFTIGNLPATEHCTVWPRTCR